MSDHFLPLAGVFAAGIVFTLILLKLTFVSILIRQAESPYDFDTTTKKLKENILAEGWIIPSVYNYQKLILDAGFQDIKRHELIELCTPKWASKMLSVDETKKVSVMLPCAFTVYERSDGKIFVVWMNNSLFAKVLGGHMGSVMGPASVEEHRMLSKLLTK